MQVPGHLQIEEIKLPAGEEWSDPSPAWRFIRLHSGAAYWVGAPAARSLAEGELILAPPGAGGVVRASRIGDVVLDAFRFMPDLLYGFFTVAERHFFENDTDGSRTVEFFPSTHPVARRFAAVVSDRLRPNSLALRLDALGVVAAAFDTELVRHPEPPRTGATVSHRFEQLIVQMPDIEMIHHSPAQLARVCGCSPRHFNRLFRKHFGVPVRSRQTELRLFRARQLLGETEVSVVDVARDCGYRNLSAFNALFKRRFGITPSAWREQAKVKEFKVQS